MAQTLETLIVRLEGDVSGLRRDLDRAQRDARRSAGGIQRSLRGIQTAATAAFAVGASLYAANGLIRGLGSLASEAQRAENAVLVFNKQLKRSNVDQREAARTVGELSERFGVLPETIQEASTLILRAGGSLSDVERALTAAGASAAATGFDISRSFENVATAVATGRSELLETSGIVANLGPVQQQYAKSIGKTVEELTDQELIQARVNAIYEESKSEIEDVDELLEGLTGSSSRVNTEFAELRRELGEFLLPAVNNVVGGFADLLSGLNDFIDNFGLPRGPVDEFKEAFDGAREAVGKAGDKESLIGALTDLGKQVDGPVKEYLDRLVEEVEQGTGAFEDLKEAADRALGSIQAEQAARLAALEAERAELQGLLNEQSQNLPGGGNFRVPDIQARIAELQAAGNRILDESPQEAATPGTDAFNRLQEISRELQQLELQAAGVGAAVFSERDLANTRARIAELDEDIARLRSTLGLGSAARGAGGGPAETPPPAEEPPPPTEPPPAFDGAFARFGPLFGRRSAQLSAQQGGGGSPLTSTARTLGAVPLVSGASVTLQAPTVAVSGRTVTLGASPERTVDPTLARVARRDAVTRDQARFGTVEQQIAYTEQLRQQYIARNGATALGVTPQASIALRPFANPRASRAGGDVELGVPEPFATIGAGRSVALAPPVPTAQVRTGDGLVSPEAYAAQVAAAENFRDTVIAAGATFATDLADSIQRGDIGGAIESLFGAGGSVLGSFAGPFAPLVSAGAGILGSIFGGLFGGGSEASEANSAQNRRNLSTLELNFTFNQQNELGLLNDPATTSRLEEMADVAFRRFEEVIRRNINPRLDALEQRVL